MSQHDVGRLLVDDDLHDLGHQPGPSPTQGQVPGQPVPPPDEGHRREQAHSR